MNKIITPAVVVVILIASIGVYFVFLKPIFPNNKLAQKKDHYF